MEKLLEKFKNVRWKRLFNKTKAISLLVSGFSMMAACVLFIFATDLFLKNNAQWLMISALIGFGASVVGLLSEIKKENKILVYSLKGVSLVLSIGFIVFLYKFMSSTIYTSIAPEAIFGMFKNKNGYRIQFHVLYATNVSLVITFICTYLSIAAQVFNITSNAILGIEE